MIINNIKNSICGLILMSSLSVTAADRSLESKKFSQASHLAALMAVSEPTSAVATVDYDGLRSVPRVAGTSLQLDEKDAGNSVSRCSKHSALDPFKLLNGATQEELEAEKAKTKALAEQVVATFTFKKDEDPGMVSYYRATVLNANILETSGRISGFSAAEWSVMSPDERLSAYGLDHEGGRSMIPTLKANLKLDARLAKLGLASLKATE